MLDSSNLKEFANDNLKLDDKKLSIRAENLLCWGFNSLSNKDISDQSKLKASAVDEINVTQKFKFVIGRVENIVGKEDNAGYQHFHLLPQCFQELSVSVSF